jgi:DNA-binding response OmpR family regulator
MFVSKLRKKLMQDPNIQLKNIRGRGYVLQVI